MMLQMHCPVQTASFLLAKTCRVVYLLMVPQKHQIKKTLSLHMELIVCPSLHLPTWTDHQHPIRQFEEELMSIISHNGHLPM